MPGRGGPLPRATTLLGSGLKLSDLAARTVLSAFDRVTGLHLLGDVFAFVKSFEGMYQGFAERAARLLLPLARAHGQQTLWITCNPDNAASRRTCERLSASYVDVVPVPRDNALYSQGDREKCRYRLDL